MQDNTNFHIDLTLTDRCNFRCKYCYEKDSGYELKDISFSIIDRVYWLIDEIFKLPKYKTVSIQFWGGEPTLRLDIVEKVVNKYIDDDRISFSIVTNGSKIPELIPIIKPLQSKKTINNKPKFLTQVSYDFQPVHKLSRIDINGNDTSDLVLNNIFLLAEMGCAYSIKSTIRLQDLSKIHLVYHDWCEVYQKLKDTGNPVKFSFFPTPDTTADNIILNTAALLNEFKYSLVKLAKEYKKKKIPFVWFESGNAFCSAGIDYASIGMNGEVVKCHTVLYSQYKTDHLFGSIFDDDILNTLTHQFKINLDNLKKQPVECDTCYAQFCLKCNIHRYNQSAKDDYFDRWTDYSNSNIHCEIFKLITQVKLAMNKLR